MEHFERPRRGQGNHERQEEVAYDDPHFLRGFGVISLREMICCLWNKTLVWRGISETKCICCETPGYKDYGSTDCSTGSTDCMTFAQ